jgi:hypothetical protein
MITPATTLLTEKAAVFGERSRLVVPKEFGAPVGETFGATAAFVRGEMTIPRPWSEPIALVGIL